MSKMKATQEYARKVWEYKQGEVVSLMIHIGDRLGLYQAMTGSGSMTPRDLATATNTSERWIREWLFGQAAAGLILHEGGAFTLLDEGSAVLANEHSSPFFSGGAFDPLDAGSAADLLVQSFSTGRGFSYDDQGSQSMEQQDRMSRPWIQFLLVRSVLKPIEGLDAKLSKGASVLDIGCGSGTAIAAMAAAYPNCRFTGVDSSELAISKAQSLGIEQATFIAADSRALEGGPTFDLVTALDCLHDMTRPDLALRDIRSAISDDGVLVIKDIKTTGDFERDQGNPLLALMYGYSVSGCLPSGLSAPDGLGLGTLGFSPAVAEDMAVAAGFSTVIQLDVTDPTNNYFEVRP